MYRREFALGVTAALLSACSKKAAIQREERRPKEANATPGSEPDWRTLTFDASADSPEGQEALLFAPSGSNDWPVVVALHGRGEAGRGLSVGSHGWRDDYDLEAMHKRLRAPPIRSADVGDMVADTRLSAINSSLSSQPYNGICIACPYTPIVSDSSAEGAGPFGRFVVDVLLPRVATAASRSSSRKNTGIDGVSMGGRLALLVGLTRPEAFGAVGALQPAIRVEEARLLSDLAKSAMARAPFALRLVSSDEDPFLEAVRAFSDQLEVDGVAHQLVVTRGPHDYVWNRGPGACELLMFHERALRGLPPA